MCSFKWLKMNHQTHCLWFSGPHINSLGMLCMRNHHIRPGWGYETMIMEQSL